MHHSVENTKMAIKNTTLRHCACYTMKYYMCDIAPQIHIGYTTSGTPVSYTHLTLPTIYSV